MASWCRSSGSHWGGDDVTDNDSDTGTGTASYNVQYVLRESYDEVGISQAIGTHRRHTSVTLVT